MKKLIVLLAGMVAAVALLVSCERDIRSERTDGEYILAYPELVTERGRVDIESPRAYSVEVRADGTVWVVLCDCDALGTREETVSREKESVVRTQVILPTQNTRYDPVVKDRTRQAFYAYCFTDREQEHVMFFNREVK